MLVDFNKKVEENYASITELDKKVSNIGKRYISDLTVVQNELDDLKERMLSTEMYNSKDTIFVKKPLNVKMEIF